LASPLVELSLSLSSFYPSFLHANDADLIVRTPRLWKIYWLNLVSILLGTRPWKRTMTRVICQLTDVLFLHFRITPSLLAVLLVAKVEEDRLMIFVLLMGAGVVARRVRGLMVLWWISEASHQSLSVSTDPHIQGVRCYLLATLPMIVMVTHGLCWPLLSLSTSISSIAFKSHLPLSIRRCQLLEDEALVR